MKDQQWKNKISNPAQLGGIETSVIENGPARGTRIAWINTGTGLRYKVVIDRAMDIADAFHNEHSLAWLSNTGIRPPEPFSNNGLEWLRTFGGGLLVTCGLTHVGGPEKDEYGERGLHGQISNIAAELISVKQPDPVAGNMEFSMSGIVKQTCIFGPSLELRRTISGILGHAIIKIHDEIINMGNTTVPHMLLYHCNFGWPLIDEGTDIIWDGKWESPGGDKDEKIFREGNNFHKSPAPLKAHNGNGEEVAFIDINSDDDGVCTCGLHNERLGLAVVMRFNKAQLPWLTNWQHWGEGEYVTGLEPGTNPPIGQAKARKDKTLIFLAPGEKKIYDLEIEVLNNNNDIERFLRK